MSLTRTNNSLDTVDSAIESALRRLRSEVSESFGASKDHDIFQMRPLESKKIIDNLTEFQRALQGFTNPAEHAFKALPPVAGATVAFLALRVPVTINGIGGVAVEELLRSNTFAARSVAASSLLSCAYYLRHMIREDFPKLEGMDRREVPRQIAMSVRRLPVAFWLALVLSGSLTLQAVKATVLQLLRRLLRMRPQFAAPLALAAAGLLYHASQDKSRHSMSKRATAVFAEIRAESHDGKHWPSLRDHYQRIYEQHAMTIVPVSVALGVLPPMAAAAVAALIARTLATCTTLTDGTIGQLLHTPGPIGRLALLAAVAPAWVSCFIHREDILHCKQVLERSSFQDEEGLKSLVVGLQRLSPQFWTLIAVSGAVTLQAARDGGVRAVNRYFNIKQSWPALLMTGGGLALLQNVGSLVKSKEAPVGGETNWAEETFAAKFTRRGTEIADRLTPIVLALVQMQPAALVSVLFLLTRLGLAANSFAELAVNEMIHSDTVAARLALMTSVVPALVAGQHYHSTLGSSTGVEDLAKKATKLPVSFWLMVLISGFVTLQAGKEMGSQAVRKLVLVRAQVLLGFLGLNIFVRKAMGTSEQ